MVVETLPPADHRPDVAINRFIDSEGHSVVTLNQDPRHVAFQGSNQFPEGRQAVPSTLSPLPELALFGLEIPLCKGAMTRRGRKQEVRKGSCSAAGTERTGVADGGHSLSSRGR